MYRHEIIHLASDSKMKCSGFSCRSSLLLDWDGVLIGIIHIGIASMFLLTENERNRSIICRSLELIRSFLEEAIAAMDPMDLHGFSSLLVSWPKVNSPPWYSSWSPSRATGGRTATTESKNLRASSLFTLDLRLRRIFVDGTVLDSFWGFLGQPPKRDRQGMTRSNSSLL